MSSAPDIQCMTNCGGYCGFEAAALSWEAVMQTLCQLLFFTVSRDFVCSRLVTISLHFIPHPA